MNVYVMGDEDDRGRLTIRGVFPSEKSAKEAAEKMGIRRDERTIVPCDLDIPGVSTPMPIESRLAALEASVAGILAHLDREHTSMLEEVERNVGRV